MRRFADPIQVLAGPDDVPQVFRWRGRRYVVAEVLGHWLEVAPWWRTEQVQERQRQVWRVEAGGGVFDLSLTHHPTHWLLLRVLD
jgi:hypothetical protein